MEQVLIAFRFASLGLKAEDFLHAGRVVQLGMAPNRIDLLTSLTGVTFEEAWDRRVRGDLDGIPVTFLGRETLIKKMGTGYSVPSSKLLTWSTSVGADRAACPHFLFPPGSYPPPPAASR
jgi:hypothetical protein